MFLELPLQVFKKFLANPKISEQVTFKISMMIKLLLP